MHYGVTLWKAEIVLEEMFGYSQKGAPELAHTCPEKEKLLTIKNQHIERYLKRRSWGHSSHRAGHKGLSQMPF